MADVPSVKQIEEANRSILYGYAYSIPPVNRDFPASISATTIKYIESIASLFLLGYNRRNNFQRGCK